MKQTSSPPDVQMESTTDVVDANTSLPPPITEEFDMLLKLEAQRSQADLIAELRKDEHAFTLKVMTSLPRALHRAPARAYRLSVIQRAALVCTPTAIAATILATTGRSGEFLIDATMDIATATITPNVIGLVLLISACVLGTIVGVVRSR